MNAPVPVNLAEPLGFLLGESSAVVRLRETIVRVAGTPRTTVLVRGERGVGKRSVARAIHERSARANGPLIAVGAADVTRPGSVEAIFGPHGRLAHAAGGTFLICEVAKLDAPAQAALLHELQTERVDARIVATTRYDLERETAAGRFREDLLYRLNVLTLTVPPLRERLGDLAQLARHFGECYAAEQGGRLPGFTAAALAALEAHGWPGNVRELRHTIEGALLRAADDATRAIDGDDLHLTPAHPPLSTSDSLPLGDRTLRNVEQALIRRVLAESDGNRSLAARTLGINRTTLYNKLRTYELRTDPR